MKDLINQLNQANHAYYVLNKPMMTDKKYDSLYDKLVKIEETTGVILTNSPTQKVGAIEVKGLMKVKHSKPALSLQKTKSEDELKKWLKDKEGLLSWKLDGLSVSLKYENGELIQGVTRGDGNIGEDITHNVKVFTNVPLKIPYKNTLEVRGEALISYKTFEKINELQLKNGEDLYATPRNLASGSVRQLNNQTAKERYIDFIAFELISSDNSGPDTCIKSFQFEFLKRLGFTVVEHIVVEKYNIIETIQDYNKSIENYIYPTDGLVLTYNNSVYANSLETTSHHPLHSIAFKWADNTKETTYKHTEWNTGRTGVITPTAVFNPVTLDNTIVTKASLHNIDIWESMELGVNDVITVYKANMIIPQIDENLTKSAKEQLPNKCPNCGGGVKIYQPKEARFLICTNDLCSAKLLEKFTHFVSRDAMNIDGLSKSTLEKFINKGFLNTFDDIYNLENYKSEIIKMERFGAKSYKKLTEAIEKSRKTEMHRFLYALGIPKIGRTASKTISKYFKNKWFDFEKACLSGFNFAQLEDFGQVMNDNIISWYNDETNKRLWVKATCIIEFVKEETKTNDNLKDLTGSTFVVTGSVYSFQNRKQLEELIVSFGGKLSSSVSSNTNFLINNDIHSTSGKNKKAKDLGIPIIDEIEFNKIIGRIIKLN